MKDKQTGCKFCKWARWERTPTGRIATKYAGRCQVVVPLPVFPSSFPEWRRTPFYFDAIHVGDGVDCPLFEVAE